MPITPIGVPVHSNGPQWPNRREAAWRQRMEGAQSKRQTVSARSHFTEADLIFSLDAADLGFLEERRGLAAYYRRFGMLPPRYVAEVLPRIEFTNFDTSIYETLAPAKGTAARRHR